jgi:hypothetical protein
MTDLPVAASDTARDIALVEQRRLYNRYPRLSAAFLFGTATAVGWTAVATTMGWELKPVGTAVLASGALLGANIGRTGRSRRQLGRAILIGGVNAVITVIFTCVTLAYKGAGMHQLLQYVLHGLAVATFQFPLPLFFYPLPIATSIALYFLRSRVPSAPRMLGCGQLHYVAELPQKEAGQ